MCTTDIYIYIYILYMSGTLRRVLGKREASQKCGCSLLPCSALFRGVAAGT